MRALVFLVTSLLLGCEPVPTPPDAMDGGVDASVPAPTPSLSSLVPPVGYLNRTIVIQLGGVNTHFEAGTIVDFDDPNIGLAWTFKSQTSLEIYANIGPLARLGPHDVTVMTFGPRADQPVNLVLRGGFTVEASLMLEPSVEALGQGQLTQMGILNLDYRDNPFSASSVTVTEGPRLISLSASSASRYAWTGLVDALAPAKPLLVSLTAKNPLGQKMVYWTSQEDKNAQSVRGRTAVLLKENEPKSRESLERPLATSLYKVNVPDGNRVLMLSFENVGVGLLLDNLTTMTAPASGRFAEGQQITFPSLRETTFTALAWLADGGPTYLAVFAGTLAGAADRYSYDLTARTATAKPIDLTERQPDTAAAPLVTVALDGPLFADSGSIEPAADIDYIRFTPAKAGRVHAQATGSQAYSLKILFLQEDCTTPITTSRGFQHEAEVEAGKQYCLRLSAAAATPYRLILAPQL